MGLALNYFSSIPKLKSSKPGRIFRKIFQQLGEKKGVSGEQRWKDDPKLRVLGFATPLNTLPIAV